jgi:hypothetical protein
MACRLMLYALLFGVPSVVFIPFAIPAVILAAAAVSIGFIDLRYCVQSAPKPRVTWNAVLAIVMSCVVLFGLCAVESSIIYFVLIALLITTVVCYTPIVAVATGAKHLLSLGVRPVRPGGITAAVLSICLPMLIAALAGAHILADLDRERDHKYMLLQSVSASYIQGLAKGSGLWAQRTNGGYYPRSLQEFQGKSLSMQSLRCPANKSEPKSGEFVSDYEFLFERAPFRVAVKDLPPSLPLVWEKAAFFEDGRHVGFADGTVEFVSEDELRELMRKVDRWIAEHPKRRKTTTSPPAATNGSRTSEQGGS